MPRPQTEMQKKQLCCPGRHDLPHKGRLGDCTPLYCADPVEVVGAQGGGKGYNVHAKKAREAALVPVDVPRKVPGRDRRSARGKAKTTHPVAQGEEAALTALKDVDPAPPAFPVPDGKAPDMEKDKERLTRAAGRAALRMALVQVPEGLSGEAAEAWADKKAVELLPRAMGELEFQLKYGDDSQRAAAAKEVREMTGRGKRELGNQGGPTIVIVSNRQDGGIELPWMKRKAEAAAQLVDGGDKP